MPKRVIHRFNLDFDKLKENQRFSSVCGRSYIAGPKPTEAESKEIEAKTQQDPMCKKCDKLWAERTTDHSPPGTNTI